MISKSTKFPYIAPLGYCQKWDFEADPINKTKPLLIKTFSPISKSIKIPYITPLRYCQKLDFEADPINNTKPLLIKTIFSDLKIN